MTAYLVGTAIVAAVLLVLALTLRSRSLGGRVESPTIGIRFRRPTLFRRRRHLFSSDVER